MNFMFPKFLLFSLALAFATNATSATATPKSAADTTLSPYFVVKSTDSESEQLPLKATSAQVEIAGVIAHVKVTQVYQNQGKTPIEAIYVFPGSTRAAVFGMKMTIGERILVAKIQEREKARRTYEDAKKAGKSASLLEQQRPNVFQMNVANILPGDTIKVELDYTELLVPEQGVYEFVYPAVVGPRFSEKKKEGASDKDKWVASGYLRKGHKVPYKWDLQLGLNAGLDIQNISSPSHKIKVSKDQQRAQVQLPNKQGGDRDFVLRYTLRDKEITTGLLLYPGLTKKDENFFLMMLQPPERLEDKDLPPREYVFILDTSGSMHGFPMNTAKGVMRKLLSGLRTQDSFNIMFFSGDSFLLSQDSLRASKKNIDNAMTAVDSQRGGGGTRLGQALQRALALPTEGESTSRTFIVVTDGYIAVETQVFELIRENLGEANLFAFGIGKSVNRHLIEGMARVGLGEPFVVLDQQEADPVATKFRKMIDRPALTRINVEYDGFEAYDVVPQAIPDLFAERPIVVFGKYRGSADGRMEITGKAGQENYDQTIAVSDFRESKDNQAIKYLWARHRIASLVDLNFLQKDDQRKAAVIELGLNYNLLTPFTSFVAVDQRVRNQDGKLETVNQPLPLPAGVEETALATPLRGRSSGLRSTLAMPGRKRPAPPSYKVKRTPKPRIKEKKVQPSQKQGLPKLTIGKVEGSNINKGSVKKALKRIQATLENCYSRRDQDHGRIIVMLKIDAKGRVLSVRIKQSSVSMHSESCLLMALKKLSKIETKSETTSVLVELIFKR